MATSEPGFLSGAGRSAKVDDRIGLEPPSMQSFICSSIGYLHLDGVDRLLAELEPEGLVAGAAEEIRACQFLERSDLIQIRVR